MSRTAVTNEGHIRLRKAGIESIPAGWDLVPFCDIVVSYRNGIYKKPMYYGKGHPSVRMYNIEDGVVNTENAPLLEVSSQELHDYGLLPNDILINRVNSMDLVGKAAIVPDTLGSVTFESKNIRVRLNLDLCEPWYIAYFLNSNLYLRQLRSHVKAAVSQATINQKDLDRILVPLPPLNEQVRIMEILNNCRHQIDTTKEIMKQGEILKKGLMQCLLTRGIGHTKFKKTKIGEIPESWEIRALGELSKINARSLNDKTDSESEIEYIEIASIEDPGYIEHTSRMRYSEAPSRARRIVRKGDVIVSTVRPYLKAIALIRQDSDDLVASTGFAVLTPLRSLDSEFLLQSVFSEYFMAYLTRRMVGSNYPAVTAKDIEQYQLACPPEKEQRRIASILRIVDEKMETERKYCIELECLKKGLMQVLLTGKVRVKV